MCFYFALHCTFLIKPNNRYHSSIILHHPTSTQLYRVIYLAEATSWRLPPFPPVAGDSWDPGPARRRRRPVRRHGDQGTEGQHPVGSMPVEGGRRRRGLELRGICLHAHISRHSFPAICIFFHMSSFVNMAPLSIVFP